MLIEKKTWIKTQWRLKSLIQKTWRHEVAVRLGPVSQALFLRPDDGVRWLAQGHFSHVHWYEGSKLQPSHYKSGSLTFRPQLQPWRWSWLYLWNTIMSEKLSMNWTVWFGLVQFQVTRILRGRLTATRSRRFSSQSDWGPSWVCSHCMCMGEAG